MKTQRYAVRIKPVAPIRVTPYSHARKTGALVHSDTLHAALMTVAALTGSPLLDKLSEVRIGSIYSQWRQTRFYPMPRLPRSHEGESRAEDRKRWKSVRLVSETLLLRRLAGHGQAFDDAEIRGSFALAPDDLKGTPAFPDALVHADLVPGVTVDRHNAGTRPFDRRCMRVDTSPRAGGAAWFVVELDPEDQTLFETLVEHLGVQGLGADRSVGYGQFDLKAVEPYAPPGLPENAPGLYALGLYLPRQEEVAAGVLDAPAAYDCAIRGGWIHGMGGTELRKRSVRMCVEGSVVRAVPGLVGQLADLTPRAWRGDHPIYRSGRVLGLPCALPEGGTVQ